MKKIEKAKYFILGVLIASIFSHAIPVLATVAEKTIQVFTGVRIYVDDIEIQPKDSNGNPVDIFIYNGTTYLPVRAISNVFGTNIEWDGATQSVFLGKHSDPNAVTWIQDLDYFTGNDFVTHPSLKDNLGADRDNNISGRNGLNGGAYSISNLYKINGQYTKISGTLFRKYEFRSPNQYDLGSSKQKTNFVIIGDGKTLFSEVMDYGIEPIDFEVDITGVLELQIDWSPTSLYGHLDAISNFGLWK